MNPRLHVANGGSTLDALRAGGVTEAALSWDDVLHEGPLRSPGDPARFRRLRARHLAAEGWVDSADVLESLETRDREFERGVREGPLLLWFEHDLYDQLQLLQIFHRLGEIGAPPDRIRLLCIDRYPGIEPFHGLGQLRPQQLVALGERAVAVASAAVEAAGRLWEAICEPEPVRWVEQRREPVAGLPFLQAALCRWIEEFPSLETGLSRTETQILHSVRADPRPLKGMFGNLQRVERAPFLGDWSFVKLVRDLVDADPALLAFDDRGGRWPSTRRPPNRDLWNRAIRLTEFGREVLCGNEDRVKTCGIDRWLGGVHLNGTGPIWRYDSRSEGVQRSES